MNALVLQDEFDSLHARICPDPETLTPGQREHRRYPSEIDVFKLLATLASKRYQDSPTMEVTRYPAYSSAIGVGLIARNGTKWSSGIPYHRHKLTLVGERYLHALRRRLFVPVVADPEPVCLSIVPAGF